MSKDTGDAELDDLIEFHLRKYIETRMKAYGDSVNMAGDPINPLEMTRNKELPSLVASYVSIRLQEQESKRNDKLSESNNRLQSFLALFAGISTVGVIIEALAATHVLG
jgi:hypothetical protein